jgi:hypothetical protein
VLAVAVLAVTEVSASAVFTAVVVYSVPAMCCVVPVLLPPGQALTYDPPGCIQQPDRAAAYCSCCRSEQYFALLDCLEQQLGVW